MITDTIFNHPVTASVIAALLLLGVIAKLMKFSFERIAKWYLYVSVFSIIIVMNSIFFPFIGGKDFFFRFVTELSLACMVLWWAFEAKKGDAKKRIAALFHKPLVLTVTVFAAVFELACLFAYDMHAAFWSNYERGEGGFQMLHYYLFFLLLVLIFTDEKDWKNLFRFSLAAAGLMILYGIAGNYSVAGFIGPYAGTTVPTGWWHELVDGRFQGSLGNSAYVDAYLIFSMFFAAYLWLSSIREKTITKLKAWGYGVLIAILFIFFVLGQTRGALLGLGAGILATVLYLVFSNKGPVRKWGSIVLIIFVLLGVGLYAVRNQPFIKNAPEGRLLQISLSDPTAQTRLWVWDEAWKGFLERPVLGWGPENFTTVFDKFFNPKFYVPNQNTETWFDRAHSVFFDYLSETGIVGLLSYLGIFFVFYWEFAKSAHKNAASKLQKALIFAVPIAYLGQGVAIFDVFPMYISIFGFLAFAAYYFSVHKKAHA
ncbi:MAG TPA: O-antigen ligase family protein [Candidatus Paceibacterota bacterium]|nr:O-antigen ligase family protein [Candidatus Paceibacterota bacterium]